MNCMLFSHAEIRPSQKELAMTINCAIKEKTHSIVHAPTGLGKTAAALCAALDAVKEKDLIVVFLTSRHTQHKIVLDTVRKFNEKNDQNVLAVSLIGKKNMCAQDVDNLPGSDFAEYCKSLVAANQCEFFTNARGKNNFVAKKIISELKANMPLASEEVHKLCTLEKVCPYEISLMLAEDAKIVVVDYYYMFHPNIRESFLGKIKKKLEQVVLIVDEAHNLPSRLRDLQTFRLSNKVMRLAIGEAKKFGLDAVSDLAEIQEVLNVLSDKLPASSERLVREKEVVDLVERWKKFDILVEELHVAAQTVHLSQKTSHISAVANFLGEWKGKNEGFAAILRRDDMTVTLTLRCLDPSLMTNVVFRDCFAAALMSATLEPLDMYAQVLGLESAKRGAFESPFPKENRLVMVVPKTTTKFQARSEKQFDDIARIIGDVSKRISGCVMVFFPSYAVRDMVSQKLPIYYDKNLFFEMPQMSKEERQILLERFSSYKEKGAILLAVSTGSFGEGVDLPGVLKGVIVVGLPLDKPDLETTQLIEFYDRRFGKGWEFGYILPAMARCVQNAGRCIRTEKDRGVIVFLDERYAQERYRSCFPKEWSVKTTFSPEEDIARFFGKLF